MPREYERFPRLRVPYYDTRFPYLSQGDVFDSVPFPVIGADFVRIDAIPGAIFQRLGVQRAMVVSPPFSRGRKWLRDGLTTGQQICTSLGSMMLSAAICTCPLCQATLRTANG